jgi:hypothetical protein
MSTGFCPGGALAEGDGQQAAGDRQADAFGLGGSGELGLPVGSDNNGLTLGGLELRKARVQIGHLLLPTSDLLLKRQFL